MKSEPTQSPLDQKIDALLASQPLEPSQDFTRRVLASIEDEKTEPSPGRGKLLSFPALALAAAAALLLSLSLLHFGTDEPAPGSLAPLSRAEAQEIFLLEESLASLSEAGIEDFGSEDLFNTLEAFAFEI